MTLISVIIPAHNRVEMLRRAVDSVLSQSLESFELHVVDDGSTDPLEDIRLYVTSAGHHWHSQKHAGVSAARNHGVRKSRGQWLAFLDSDDYWLPTKLTQQLMYHEAHTDCQISQCEERWIRNGTFVNKKQIHTMPDGEAFSRSIQLCCVSPSSVMLSRELFETYGPFDESLPVCEDYDLWLKITREHRVGLIPESLVVKHGGHLDQLSRSEPAMDRYRVFALLRLLSEYELSVEHRSLVVQEVKKKISILRIGAKKHNTLMIPLYDELLAALEESHGQELIFPKMKDKISLLIQKVRE